MESDLGKLLVQVSAMERDLKLLREDVHELKTAGLPSCALHYMEVQGVVADVAELKKQIAEVHTVIGKKELLVASFSALGLGFAFFVKFLWGRLAQ